MSARCLVGGIGYPDLSDHSLSWAVVSRLQDEEMPAHVVVEDISYNPVAVAQRLDDEPSHARFARLIVVSAVERGRPPGTVTAYRWDGRLPSDEEVHRSVTDAVTGIIFLDNTLVVARHLGSLPRDVAIVEVEPAREAFGERLSPVVAGVMDEVCTTIRQLAAGERPFEGLRVAGLGGPKVGAGRV